MKRAMILAAVCVACVLGGMRLNAADDKPAAAAAPGAKKERLFEMRTYTCLPGRLDALNARFRDHTNRLFVKHGIELVGYWTPEGEKGKTTLVYILAFPDRAARDKSFKDFGADPEWKTAREASEKDGKIVEKVESVF